MNNEPVAVFIPAPLRYDEWKRRFTLNWIDEEPTVITHLYSEVLVRQQQAEIEALKVRLNPYQSITDTKIEPTVVSYTHPVTEMSETRIKQIFVEQTGFYFDDNPADDLALMDFAKALLLEAQEK